jgi:GNAT superfamily N-acetyltransferase
MIRRAAADDRASVEAIVRDAYAPYIERIGKPPGPMLDDYAALIAAGTVSVLAEADGEIAAIVVRQGQGLGRRLIAFAETEARRLGYGEVRLYTHVTMTENIALYARLGFVETGRGQEAGYARVFMTKRLA